MKDYIKLMRVKHYIKNGLIILPIFFSQGLFNYSILKNIFFAFLSFSLMCSVVYIINDIKDIEKDRKHPEKKTRPLASGRIKKKNAYALLTVLLVVSLVLNMFSTTGKNLTISYLLLICYLVLNILYSFGLKNIPLIDIIILVSGFVIRIIYGSVITNIEISSWLYLTVMSMAFYLGLGKRRKELEKNDSKSRKVLEKYSKNFLDKNMYLCMCLTIIFYSLWTIDPVISQNHKILIWTVPLVLIICMMYSMDIEGSSYGDPVEVIINNKCLLLIVIIYIILMFFIFYGNTILSLLG